MPILPVFNEKSKRKKATYLRSENILLFFFYFFPLKTMLTTLIKHPL